MALVEHVLAKKERQVWTIGENDSVYQAIQEMALRDIGAVVVVEGDRVTGIFTERHYTRDVFLKGRASPTTRVGDVMRADPTSIRSDQHLGECIDLMERNRIRHLPVVDNGALVGIVSMGDILRSIIAEEQFDISSLMKYIARTR